MEQMREAKLTKSDAPTSPAMGDAQPEPTTSITPGESSEAPFGSLQGTAGEYQAEASTESLDGSLHVSVTVQMSEDDSSESEEEVRTSAMKMHDRYTKGGLRSSPSMSSR